MTNPTPIVVRSDPTAASNSGQMDRVRKGDTLKVAQRDPVDPTTGWEIQTDQGHRIAGIKWPAASTPARGSLLVTETTPPSPKRAEHITGFQGELTPETVHR